MARKSQDLKRIEAREAKLAAKIAEASETLERLRCEHVELTIAKRVLSQLAIQELMDGDGLSAEASPEDDEDDETPPEGQNLTIGDMAIVVLKGAETEGLTSGEILDAIRKGWSPDLARTSLSPPLSRLKKRGILEQVDDRWRIIAGSEADPF